MNGILKKTVLLITFLGIVPVNAGLLDAPIYIAYDAAKTAFSALVPNLWCVMGGCSVEEVKKARLKLKVYLAIFGTAALAYSIRHYLSKDDLERMLIKAQEYEPTKAYAEHGKPHLMTFKDAYDSKYDVVVETVRTNDSVKKLQSTWSGLRKVNVMALPKNDLVDIATKYLSAAADATGRAEVQESSGEK